MNPTPIHPGWVNLVPNCTVEIVVPNPSEGVQSHGRVIHETIGLAGTMFLVEWSSNMRVSSYRLTYAPDPEAVYGLRYEGPPIYPTSTSLRRSIANPALVDQWFGAAQAAEYGASILWVNPEE